MRSIVRLIILFTVALITVNSILAQSPDVGFVIRGDISKAGVWSVDDLKRQFAKEVQTVKFTVGEDKQQKTGTGIPLLSLIKAAELKT